MSRLDPCRLAAELVSAAERALVVTGAGISTESGIPDFRSPGGLWSRYDPTTLTYHRFLASEETRTLYWQIACQTYPVMRDAEPNAAHRAVAAIEEHGKLLMLVTQNVDGLHRKAGSSRERTVEIHGSALRVRCVECGAEHDREAVHERVLAGEAEPTCDRCSGWLKPATVSFGQAMPERETAAAFAAAADCDLVLVIGSSLAVYPAAAIPETAARAGAPLVIVNREPTPLDELAAVIVHGAAGESMSRIVEAAGLSEPSAAQQ